LSLIIIDSFYIYRFSKLKEKAQLLIMELRISHDVSKSRKIFLKVNKQLFKKVKKTVLVKTKNSKIIFRKIE